MDKITASKHDDVASIVEHVVNASTAELTLSIPRFSKIGEDLKHFQLLAREAAALDKKVTIESVDERVIELAKLAGFAAVNPFFAGSGSKRTFSDITPVKLRIVNPAPAAFKDGKKGKKEAAPARTAMMPLREHAIEAVPVSDGNFRPDTAVPDEIALPPLDVSSELHAVTAPHAVFRAAGARIFSRPFGLFIFICGLLGAGAWAAAKELPRAEVNITAKKAQWIYNGPVIAEKGINPDALRAAVPSQAFTFKKNGDIRFPASGKRHVEKKASGKITVYNGYSSDPQPLVAGTRFMSPDGKIFKLTERIIVPGAKITDGKIIPSSIETVAIADQPGADYNIGATKNFSIPGFKGSPKYQAFSAESVAGLSGGLVGEQAYPTAEDINAAKEKSAAVLREDLELVMQEQMPEGMKVLENAVQFAITSQTVKDAVDDEGKFSIFTNAHLNVIALRDQDVRQALIEKAAAEKGGEFDILSSSLSYSNARADFKTGALVATVDFKADLRQKVDVQALATKVLGKSEIELKSAVLALQGLEGVNIDLWPFWVRQVPSDMGRVKITVD